MGALAGFVEARTVDRHVVSASAARGEGGEGDGSWRFRRFPCWDGGCSRDRRPACAAGQGSCRCDDLGEPARRVSLQPSVCRGLPLSSAATASSSCWEKRLRSVRLGKYWRSGPLVSFDPRCQGLRGSQKSSRSLDRELRVLAHLLALVPGKRATRLLGSGPMLRISASRTAWRRDRRGARRAGGSGSAHHQRRDPGRELAEQQIAFR